MYNIHSPRAPKDGLKTRSYEEVITALKNLVNAIQKIREKL
ncbi:hypothetical protein [Campylobacter jejuni]